MAPSAMAPSAREGHCWCRRAWCSLVVVPWVLAAASAFSQPFFCFEGQHPPRQQGVDDLTPAGGAAVYGRGTAGMVPGGAPVEWQR